MKDIFRGNLVRLATETPEVFGKAVARWERDSEYHRLADNDPAKLWSEKKQTEWIEKRAERDPAEYVAFSIRTLAEDRFIGEVMISVNPIHGNGWVGIAIGERDFWSKGYGTDAMELITQYGFLELNLHRLSLGVHAYNHRAVRCYEKVGYRIEGTVRGDTYREGRRTDGLFMGILRREWLAMQGAAL
jgi:RimJ/RimL family protein N-acetyltransferase